MSLTRRRFVQISLAAMATSASGIQASTGGLIQRTIPSSGEFIPAMGIGTNRYGVTSEEELAPIRETLALFARRGGRLIDTAPSYGRGVSEQVIGNLANELGISKDLFLATKVDGRTDGPRQLAASLEKLRVPSAELVQVHNLRAMDQLLPFLRAEKAAGRVGYVGVTTSRREQFPQLIEVLKREPLDFVQVNYSLDDRLAAEQILPLAASRGVAVLVNLPFGRGRLFEKVGDRPLPDFAAEFGCQSWGQFFLKYILGHPAVTCPIPGTRKPHHLEDNLAAATGDLPDADLRRRQEEFFDAL